MSKPSQPDTAASQNTPIFVTNGGSRYVINADGSSSMICGHCDRLSNEDLMQVTGEGPGEKIKFHHICDLCHASAGGAQ